MNLMTWLKAQWRKLIPGKVQTLGVYGTLSNGAVFQRGNLPREIRISTTAPNHTDEWVQYWRWVGEPMEGVTISPLTAPFTYVSVEEGAPVGGGTIECEWVRLSDNRVVVSNPYWIRVVEPQPSFD